MREDETQWKTRIERALENLKRASVIRLRAVRAGQGESSPPRSEDGGAAPDADD
jgi:hypothetical protein